MLPWYVAFGLDGAKSYTWLALKLLQDVILFVLSVFGLCCVNFDARKSQGMRISVLEYSL